MHGRSLFDRILASKRTMIIFAAGKKALSMTGSNMDFGSGDVRRLFRRLFIPTLTGMLFNSAFIITDGIFVGRGVGPDGLAGVNLVAPVMMLITGLGVMFGIGGSVAAAVHLSKGHRKAARANISQSVVAALLPALMVSGIMYAFPEAVLRLLGTSGRMMPATREYLLWVVPTCVLLMVQIVGEFGIRLDGSPKYAMYCSIVPSLVNIALDYLFIMQYRWGLMGAAFATDIGTGIGAAMTLWYYFRPGTTRMRFLPFIVSRNSIRLFLRHMVRMVKVGFSGFIGEFAISATALCGNLAFGRSLGDGGIAAFSVACYIYPLVINVFISVTAAAQPIISFNHGAGKPERARATFRCSMRDSMVFAAVVTVMLWLFSPQIISVFLDEATESYGCAVPGLPLYALGFVLNGFNASAIGYFQSVESNVTSTLLMALRGILLPSVLFLLMPVWFGTSGLWLAIPASECITAAVGARSLARG